MKESTAPVCILHTVKTTIFMWSIAMVDVHGMLLCLHVPEETPNDRVARRTAVAT